MMVSDQQHLEEMVELQNAVLCKLTIELYSVNERILDTMSRLLGFRDIESGDHVKRVMIFTNILAQYAAWMYPEYHMDEQEIHRITSASALHDVGKIAIPDAILLKPGRLTEDEFAVMKTHTIRGSDIIQMLTDVCRDEYGRVSYEICRYHHERYDGHGYPDGLKGENIPISAQIVSIADVYDALVSERCYKKAYTTDEAYHMMTEGECGVFSPKLMECLRMARAEFEAAAMRNSQ